MSTQKPSSTLLGRRRERAALDALLDAVRSGESRVLVIRGDAGIGKSALLRYAAAQATGCRVVHVLGVQSEMQLAYAGLHQLCMPLLDRLELLPTPQRDALRTAFGMRAGNAPDRFLVGLAVLSLLGAATDDRPLVCLVDDVQWLDQTSVEILEFVARRLAAESVAAVFACRTTVGDHTLQGLPEIGVTGLGYHEARALLQSSVPGLLDERVYDRLIAETSGNPLALIELPRGLNPAQLAGGFGVPHSGLLPARVERSYVRLMERMPQTTRHLLLIAAAEPTGDPAVLVRAATEEGLDVQAALKRAEGLITVDSYVRFRHPLVRSAVYGAASAVDRRRAHAALAEAVSRFEDGDRRVWHRAHATAEPDETVAAELETSAGQAQARGGLAAAAAFLERAVALTPDPERRAQRALAAGRAAYAAGGASAASELLQVAGRGPLGELDEARCQQLAAEIAFQCYRSSEAPGLLDDAARRLAPLEPALSRATHLQAIWAACFALHIAATPVVDIAAAVRAAGAAAGDPTPEDLMLDGLATRFVDGSRAAAPTLRRALRDFDREGLDGSWVWLAVELWDTEAWFALGALQVREARRTGALSTLPVALHSLAAWHVVAGELDAASSLVAEAESILEATGDAPMTHALLMLAALRGDDDAHELITTTIEEATKRGEGILIRHAEAAAATLYVGLGRFPDALTWARREADHNAHDFYLTALPDLVEAAVRCDDYETARWALERLCAKTQASDMPWARGIEARTRALLATDDGEVDRLYREAAACLDEGAVAVDAARARLLHGEWLRQHGRRTEAQTQLRSAHDAFVAMGARPFAERAARELRATGAIVRGPDTETRNVLSPQEAQIARLAADGRTNGEIGAQLFLSPRTVEWHLGRVFSKLGVRSRKELNLSLTQRAR